MPEAQDLVAFAIGAGLVDDEQDLELVERLAVEVTGRREAYIAGQRSIKGASLDVCAAADWSRVANDVDDARRARAHRANMLQPRPNDYQGRRPA